MKFFLYAAYLHRLPHVRRYVYINYVILYTMRMYLSSANLRLLFIYMYYDCIVVKYDCRKVNHVYKIYGIR